MSKLGDSWIEGAGGGVIDLRGGLRPFPELAAASAPPKFGLEVEQGELRDLGHGELSLTLRAALRPPESLRASVGEESGLIEIDIDTLEREIRLEALELPAALQRQRLGRLLIAQLAGLSDALELERFCLQAGRVGRWAWMRCGFDFRDPSDRECVVAAAERFAGRLGRSPDLSAIHHSWDFLALPGEVSPTEIAAAGGPVIEAENGPVSLPKALLLGPAREENVWFGEMDLAPRSASRVRLGEYVS